MSDQTSLREQVYQFFWQEMQSGILAPGASINILKKILMPIKRRLYNFHRRDYIKEWEMINIDEHDRLIICIKKGNRLGAASIIKDEHWNFDYHQKYLKKFYTLNRET